MTDIETIIASAEPGIIATMNAHAAPGLAVGVIHDGELIHQRGFGLADTKAARPVTPDTVFRIGSITKTMVGIAVMQLVEEGLVDLDDPIADHLTTMTFGQPDDGPRVTVRHVMAHLSGVGELRSLADVVLPSRRIGVDEDKLVPSIADYYRRRPLTAELPAGQTWAYANHAIAALGQVVEEVSGEPLGDRLRTRVLEPLGMMSSSLYRDERVADQLAVGYKLSRRKGLVPVPYRHIAIPAAGSMFSSVPDMARFSAALMGGGSNSHGQVIKPDSLETMWQPQFTVDERLSFHQGLSFMCEDWDGRRIVHHGGGWPGFISMMMIAPDDKLAVVAFTNGTNPSSNVVARSLLRRLLGLSADADRLPVGGILERPETWSGLLGSYGVGRGLMTSARPRMLTGGEVQVLIHDGHLALRGLIGKIRKPVRLHPTNPEDPDVFGFTTVDQGTVSVHELAFERDPVTGQATTLNGTVGVPIRLHRRPAWRSLRTLTSTAAAAAGLGTAVAFVRRR